MILQNKARKKSKPFMVILMAFLCVLGIIPITTNISANEALPTITAVTEIGQEYTHDAYVTMNGNIISSRRYAVNINNVFYEAYCANPTLRGPGNSGAVYELSDVDGSQFRTVLRYGFPVNTALTASESVDELSWFSYMTRVAVAYISVPSATWGRLEGITLAGVNDRINGVGGAEAEANFPAITVNGEAHDFILGIDPQSPIFAVGNNRKTNCRRNPFRFEWTADTPAGTRLYVDGTLAATAPANPNGIYSANPHHSFNEISAFHLVLPTGSESITAGVNLVGINNQYADRVFVMQNPNDTDGWQDIIFYVPEVFASAEYTWEIEPQTPDLGRLRIIKRSAEASRGLAGAVFQITGANGYNVTRTTPSNGEILLTNLEAGQYTITETSPPVGYSLSEPMTQTVQVTANTATEATVIFANPRNGEPPNESSTSVFIEKIDALSRENVPNATHPHSGALIRLQGMSSMTVAAGDGQSVTFNNTGINLSQVLTETAQITPTNPGVTSTVGNGWWHLEGLPYGFYSVVEERAPDGFSILPQHTAYSFWLHPPDVTIGLNVIETEVVIPWDDVLAMLQALSGSSTPAMDLQAVLDIMTTALGAVELVVLPVYEIEQSPHVNAAHIVFENYPFSEIVVYKHDNVTNEPLATERFVNCNFCYIS
ncbi:MAG: prealbumin-like fold domain-containing protein [Defluviitaleaceae bacterium]|nr:prealbumin-like fold domain-containing protein [Defluviitaleaceae bacterium]